MLGIGITFCYCHRYPRIFNSILQFRQRTLQLLPSLSNLLKLQLERKLDGPGSVGGVVGCRFQKIQLMGLGPDFAAGINELYVCYPRLRLFPNDVQIEAADMPAHAGDLVRIVARARIDGAIALLFRLT